MTFLPIVDRELRVRARQAGTYRGRWVAVAIALLLSQPLLLSSNPRTGPADGKMLFTWLTVLAFAYCLFGGARLTSDCLSSEKREGTLGLLFLTHLKGHDVVLGKLVANSLSSFYGLLAIMPVFGVALLAGGVTGGEFWRVSLALVNTLFLSLALGLWVSARSQDEQKIVAGSNLLLVGLAGGLPLLDVMMTGHYAGTNSTLFLGSPAYGCYLAFDLPHRTGAQQFWTCLGIVHGLGWLFLALAAKAVVRYREDELVSESVRKNLLPAPENQDALGRAGLIESAMHRTAERKRLLDQNPVYWLAHSQPGQRIMIWTLAGLWVGAILFPLLSRSSRSSSGLRAFFIYWPQFLIPILALLFWFAVATMACRFFVQARRNGTLELLLSTPLRDRDILAGQWLHLKQLLAGPLVCIFLAQVAATLAWHAVVPNMRPVAWHELFYLMLSAAGFVTQTLAICWVGIWLALSAKKPAQAASKTFAYVTLAPWLFCSGVPYYMLLPLGLSRGRIPGFSFLMGLRNPMLLISIHLLFIRWARKKLRPGVRIVAPREMFGESSPPYVSAQRDPKSDLSEDFSLLK